MKKPQNISEAVTLTLAWFDIFDFAPTAAEIHRWFFGLLAEESAVELALSQNPKIENRDGFYFFHGREEIVSTRKKNEKIAQKFWQKVENKNWIFRRTPFLSLAAVANTLAFGWPEEDSDIDIFVVAKQNRLATARIFLTFFSQLAGARRHGDKIAGRFCLSFFVDESSQNLENLKVGESDLYLAFWVASLVAVRGNPQNFWQENLWIREIFPNWQPKNSSQNSRQNWLEKILAGKFGDWLERKLMAWQLRRARSHRQNFEQKNAVVISENIFKFHESDAREKFRKKWEERVAEITKK